MRVQSITAPHTHAPRTQSTIIFLQDRSIITTTHNQCPLLRGKKSELDLEQSLHILALGHQERLSMMKRIDGLSLAIANNSAPALCKCVLRNILNKDIHPSRPGMALS